MYKKNYLSIFIFLKNKKFLFSIEFSSRKVPIFLLNNCKFKGFFQLIHASLLDALASIKFNDTKPPIINYIDKVIQNISNVGIIMISSDINFYEKLDNFSQVVAKEDDKLMKQVRNE